MHIMEFRRKYDELENLTDSQIMLIMELIDKRKQEPSEEQKERISDLENDIEGLQSELEEAEYEYTKLEQENEELKEEIRRLEQEK